MVRRSPRPQSPAHNITIAQKKITRRCLDWTERRHHLAGTLGWAMYKRFRELHWLASVKDTRLWHLLRISTN